MTGTDLGLKFDFKGGPEFDHALDAWVERAAKATIAGLSAAAAIVVKEAQASFDSGAGPKKQSGTLAGSIIATTPVPKGFDSYSVQVGPSGVLYARKIELGKQGAHHGPPHPYLQPGYTRAATQFVETFRSAWAAAGGK